MQNVLTISSREEFRQWLALHAAHSRECWVTCVRGKPQEGVFAYLDAVEEALCFGWIDSVYRNVDGVSLQRFSPRKKSSPWTELNKERARRLIRLGLMTLLGKKALPPLGPRSYRPDEEVVAALKKARCYAKFKNFPPLYQRIRISNVAFYRDVDPTIYQTALDHLIRETKAGRMYGEWNDYGRLL